MFFFLFVSWLMTGLTEPLNYLKPTKNESSSTVFWILVKSACHGFLMAPVLNGALQGMFHILAQIQYA